MVVNVRQKQVGSGRNAGLTATAGGPPIQSRRRDYVQAISDRGGRLVGVSGDAWARDFRVM